MNSPANTKSTSRSTINKMLRAPWTRKSFGGLEYLLDADGRTICTRVEGDARHEAIMSLLENVPEMLRVLDAEFSPFTDEDMTPRECSEAGLGLVAQVSGDFLNAEISAKITERVAGEKCEK